MIMMMSDLCEMLAFACSLQMSDISDRYVAPRTVEHAINLADLNLEYRTQTKDGGWDVLSLGTHIFLINVYFRAH